jgi:hypothetical protein
MGLFPTGKSLDRRHLASVDLRCKQHARFDCFTVETNGTSAANALEGAADVSTRKLQSLSQKIH